MRLSGRWSCHPPARSWRPTADTSSGRAKRFQFQAAVPAARAVVAPAAQGAGPPPSPPSSASSSEEPSEPSKPKARKPPLKHWHLRKRQERLVVRRAIFCQIPGINRIRAESIVSAYPTISALMQADVKAVAGIPIKESPLGMELAVALKRVFE